MVSKKATRKPSKAREKRRQQLGLKAEEAKKAEKEAKKAEKGGEKAAKGSKKKAKKGEEEPDEDPEEVEASAGEEEDDEPKKKRKTKANRLGEALGESESEDEVTERGTVYVSRLPWGAFEPQLMTFFKQFGTITRFQFARSIKTGNPKGWAWIEYEDIEVAEIVVKTMNGYLLEGNQLFCRLMKGDEVGRWTYPEGLNYCPEGEMNVKRRLEPQGPIRRKRDVDMKNDRPTIEVDGEILPRQTWNQVLRQDIHLDKLQKRLNDLGIDYDLSPFKLGKGPEFEAAKKARAEAWAASQNGEKWESTKPVNDEDYVEVEADEDLAAKPKRKVEASKAKGAAVAKTTEAAEADRGTVAKEEEGEAAQEGEPTRKRKKKAGKAAGDGSEEAEKPQPKKKRRPKE